MVFPEVVRFRVPDLSTLVLGPHLDVQSRASIQVGLRMVFFPDGLQEVSSSGSV